MSTNITQEIILPSKGLLNPEIPEGIVTQRCLMVSDQKYLAGSRTVRGGRIYRLLQETTTEPKEFNVNNLTLPDVLFMAFKLRILSYGNILRYQTRCPICGETMDVAVDMSEINVTELPDDFASTLEIELPRAGDKVYTRILTVQDQEDIQDHIRRIRKKTTDDETLFGIEYEQRLVKMVKRIELKEANADGEKILTHPVDITKYVCNLTDLDATAIISTVDNIEYGIDPTVETTCTECGRIVDVPIRFNADFFRPKYDTRPINIDR